MTKDEIDSIPLDLKQCFCDARAYSCALRSLYLYHEGLCGSNSEFSSEACNKAICNIFSFLNQSIVDLDLCLHNFQKYYDYSLKENFKDLMTGDVEIVR